MLLNGSAPTIIKRTVNTVYRAEEQFKKIAELNDTNSGKLMELWANKLRV
ncbi:hypothetical protein Scep_007052 [Stephania cephalantha]|uniref:Uncharacterized protein n=1 Tax=Stephania cephalantha TaxID=152367 RepID=A0AAP0KAD0_9MAGN